MKVQKVLVGEQFKFMLIGDDNQPVMPVVKYLKYLDNTGKAPNTLQAYCYHLLLYFDFLQDTKRDYKDATIDSLSEFITWLRNPHQSSQVVPLGEIKARRSERTVNTVLTCVISFYDYLARSEDYSDLLSKKLTRQISGRHRTFKPFLHHVSKGKPLDKNIIKLKEPRREIQTLTQDQIQTIHDACCNLRDELLIRVLYEAGLRRSEALSLWIEDFNISNTSIRVRKSKTSAGVGRKVYVTPETMNLFQDYLIECHNADTNFVFINLSGPHIGEPMQPWSVRDLVKRIRRKTGIDFTPHMFRHTYATELHAQGLDVSRIQKLLGHAQVQTTIQMYVHPSDETIRTEWEKAQQQQTGRLKN